MKIYYDQAFADELTEKLRVKFMDNAQDRKVVHLSDTCHCPVKCWCRLIGLNPIPPNTRGVGMMMIGIVGQEIFQNLYPEEWVEYEPDYHLPEDEQLPSHIDIYHQETDRRFPLEIKWSRKDITRADDINIPWIMQTTGYMAKTNEIEGKLIIFNIISARINVFKFVLTQEELDFRNFEIKEIKKNILKAVEEKNPNILEPWLDECTYCDYRPSRNRKKDGLGEGCPRYKGALAANLDQFLSYTSQEPDQLQDTES